MVSSLLKNLRNYIPIVGIIALLAMFLKLPEAPNVLGFSCKTCSSSSPYIPLIGGAYFAVLIAAAMLFPSFPSIQLVRGGFIWAVLLLLSLTYMHLPNWCAPCLIGHLCNVLIWAIWMITPSESKRPLATPRKERLFLMLLAPMVVAALFSSLNLTLLIYGLKNSHDSLAKGIKPGDAVPEFNAKTHQGHSITNRDVASEGVMINFIVEGCLFCKEQLAMLSTFANQLHGEDETFRLINVSPTLNADLMLQLPLAEWVEDQDGALRSLFKVERYPTLFVLGKDGKIIQVIPGVSDQLTEILSEKVRMAV